MQLVINYHNRVTTTSVLVAKKFGKRHDDVLKAIRNIECSDEFRARNFAESSYKSLQNKDLPMFLLTRDAFTMLVMGFTGPKAATFREEFIKQFNDMEEELRSQTPILIATYQKRILSEPTKYVPRGYWCVFDKSHPIMLQIEKYIGSVNQYDLVDGSIGMRWSEFRKGKPWAQPSAQFPYVHDDERGVRQCNCYHEDESKYFDDWLKYVYKPEYLFPYLRSKFKKEKNVFMLERVEKAIPKLLKRSA